MSARAAYRIEHFLSSLPFLLAGLAVAQLDSLSDFFLSLFNVLPTLLLLLGGALCVVYRRQREVSVLLVVYLAYFLLDIQTDHYHAQAQVRSDAALVFHLCSFLLPLLFGLYAAWSERSHLAQDMIARGAVLLAVVGTFWALATRYPEALEHWLAQVHWPLLHGAWMGLVQLAYPLFIAAFVLLLIQYWRQPRPLHAAFICALIGLLWLLPNIFLLPHALQIMSSLVMLMVIAAVAHEAYQMAYRDELTGLPGRRALNDRMQRLGRHYVIAMGDVDHFKQFNDTHGHDVGDQVLRLVASRLRKVGGGGEVYRYGGEEFTLVFAGKTLDECRPYLDAVREAVATYPLQLRDSGLRPANDKEGQARRRRTRAESVSVTISIGVAERETHQRVADEVIGCADKALYAAKKAGRNCVVAHGEGRRGAVRVSKEKA